MKLSFLFDKIFLRDLPLQDPITLRKVRVLASFQWIVVAAGLLLGLFYYSIGAVFLFYVAMGAALLTVPAFFLLRRTNRLSWSGNYTILIVWLSLLLISWHTGGVNRDGIIIPSWILNGGLILLAVFLNGYLWATVWTSLVFIEIGVIITLFLAGYPFPNLLPDEISAIYSFGSYLLCLLATLSFAFLFEKERNETAERERAKTGAIRDSKRYIDDILERCPVPTFVMDRNHRIIQWNRACTELSGVPLGDVIGKKGWMGFDVDGRGSMADFILDHPDAVEEVYGDRIISRDDTGWFELDMFLPKIGDGVQAVVAVAPILDDQGNILGAIETIQTHNEQRIFSDLSGYGKPLDGDEHNPIPVFRLNTRGEIIFWNRACEDSLGYKSDEMLGKSPFIFVSKRYRPHFRKTVVRAFRGQAAINAPWKYYARGNQPKYVLARVYSAPSQSGNDRQCTVVNADITELALRLKKLERYASDTKKRFDKLSEEHDLLKKNIASFIRKKQD